MIEDLDDMNVITELFRGLSDTGRLFVVVFFLSLLSILISFWTGGLVATIAVSATIISILTITKGIWESEYDAKTNVRLASLGIIYLLAISQPGWKSVVNPLIEPIIEILPIPNTLLTPESPSIVALILVVIGIYFVNFFMRDNSVMREHQTPIDKDFQEKQYPQRLQSFCTVLLDDLNIIDRETNWSNEYFTPLDAEVEFQSKNKRLRKVADLLTAIRSDHKSRVFLVIGDPGSGKSVALRKLCRELLQETKSTGKVPLYINLREWQPKSEWTEANPPTVKELYEFVVKNLKSRGDIFISDFIDTYFKKMFDHGRLFFILDSFDEIPSVLDINEGSWLIDKLSDVIYKFLKGSHESRGILASRIFRRPTNNFDAQTILEVRPFTEDKIIKTFQNSLSSNKELGQRLFRERPDLVPVARNPFTASLITSYAQDNNNQLPQTQSELYSNFINKRLDVCQDKLEEKGLTKEQVIQGTITIADTMLTTQNFGLEAPVEALKVKLPSYPLEDVIDILYYARLGRLGSGTDQRFSFVHRRINEYFVVQELIKNPKRVPQDAIPNDSRWRDALVLYCEVAEEQEARKIANFCWSEINKVLGGNVDMRDPQFLRMIHCMRFLKEAFRARVDCIKDFRYNLSRFVKDTIQNQKNLLLKKFAVETIGLLTDKDIDKLVSLALRMKNNWISNSAIKSCRHLPQISKELRDELITYIKSLPRDTDLIRIGTTTKKELSFSFKLSNGFIEIDRFLTFQRIQEKIFELGILCFYLGTSILIIRTFLELGSLNNALVVNNISASLMLFLLFSSILLMLLGTVFLDLCNSSKKLLLMVLEKIKKINLTNFIFQLKEVFILLMTQPISILIETLITIAKSTMFVILVLPLMLLELVKLPLLLFEFFREKLKITKFTRSSNTGALSRQAIARYFHSLDTNWGRLEYLEFLQNQKIKPQGEWLDGKLPNINNDEASTLLAQLEEKWLGLDR